MDTQPSTSGNLPPTSFSRGKKATRIEEVILWQKRSPNWRCVLQIYESNFSTCGKSRVWGRHAANVGLQTKMLASWPLACGQHQLSEDKDTNYAQNVLKQCPIWCSKCVTEVPLPKKMGLLTNTWVAFVNNLKYLFIIDVSGHTKVLLCFLPNTHWVLFLKFFKRRKCPKKLTFMV